MPGQPIQNETLSFAATASWAEEGADSPRSGSAASATWGAEASGRRAYVLNADTASAMRVHEGGWGPALFHVLGLLLLVTAVLVAFADKSRFAFLPEPIAAAMAGETARWVVAIVSGLCGLSILPCKPILFVMTCGWLVMTGFCLDLLLGRRLSAFIEPACGLEYVSLTWTLLVVSLAYLFNTSPRSTTFHLRSILGYLIVVAAGLGLLRGWYDLQPVAPRLGDEVVQIVSRWGDECTWAIVVIVTAIGVSLIRHRTMSLLTALLLIALAIYCVRSGRVEMKYFPELSSGPEVISLQHTSYSNVEAWRWVVALELSCVAAILLHFAGGMGLASMAFAVAWMAVGLSVFNSASRMSLVGGGIEMATSGGGGGDVFANMGLPLHGRATTAGHPAAPTGVSSGAASQSQARAQQRALVREVTTFAWIVLSAVLAGLLMASGLRLACDQRAAMALLRCLLILCFGGAAYWLWWAWPKDAEQSWLAWLTAFKYSTLRTSFLWVVFLGSTALCAMLSLRGGSSAATWVHAGASAVFLGTGLSLVGAAVMIYYGGFPALPAWVFVVVASLQSSMAWALLMHLNLSVPKRSPAAHAPRFTHS